MCGEEGVVQRYVVLDITMGPNTHIGVYMPEKGFLPIYGGIFMSSFRCILLLSREDP